MSDLEEKLRAQFAPLAERLARSYSAAIRRSYDRFAAVDPAQRMTIFMGRMPRDMPRMEAEMLIDACKRCRRYIRTEGGRMNGEMSLTEDFLQKEAATYGEEQANAFLGKLLRKLEGTTDPELLFESGDGANFSMVLKAGDSRVAVHQQAVMKFDKSCMPYHQFPARLYLDGKFLSEAAFRAHMEAIVLPPSQAPESEDDGMEPS